MSVSTSVADPITLPRTIAVIAPTSTHAAIRARFAPATAVARPSIGA